MAIISLLYLILILIYLAIGAAIIFHILYYKINRRVALMMFAIYILGSIVFLAFNYSLYRTVNWYAIFSNFGF